MSLAAIGGTLPVAKISPAGTAGQVLTSTGGTTAPTWQTLPVTSNIYTADGGLSSARTVTLAGNNLTFNASSTGQVIVQGPAGNTAGLRLSNLTGAGTAGTSGQKVLSVNASGDVVLVTDFGTANAGTVTNVTGSGLIAVANGSTTPAVSLVPGTTGQVLQMVGTTPTWVTPSVTNTSNIYTADGTLSGNRIVSKGTNTLTFSGSGSTIFNGGNVLNTAENTAFVWDLDAFRRLGFVKKSGFDPMIASGSGNPIVFALDRTRCRRLAHSRAGACRPNLLPGKQPVSAQARLPAQGPRHVHARRRHHGRRLAGRQIHQRRAQRPDRGGPLGRRSHGQAPA